MAITSEPILHYRLYRVTAPEFLPCCPSKNSNSVITEIHRGQTIKFVASPEADLWEVEIQDPANKWNSSKRALIGKWAWPWLLAIFQR